MNTLTSFFAGIMAFVSGLLGHHALAPVPQPVAVTLQASTTQEMQQAASSSTSANITSSTTTTEETEIDYGKVPNKLLNTPVVLTNNDPIATIEQIGGTVIYTTKDKSRMYFVICRETEGGCYGKKYNYLDTKKAEYHNTDIDFNPGEEKLPSFPYILPYGNFDYTNILIANVETGKIKTVYTKKENTESLRAKCLSSTVTDPTGNEHTVSDYKPDIEFTKDNQIRVGVYKNIGQDKRECTPSTQTKYEKIRDDIIDLTKIP